MECKHLKKMFGVVEFQENSPMIVPMCWLKGEFCYWPKVEELAEKMGNVEEDWPSYKVNFKSINSTFEEACESLKKQRAEQEAKQASSKTKGGQTSQNSSFIDATNEVVDGGSRIPSDDSVSKNEGDELARIGERVSKLNVSGRSEKHQSGEEPILKSMEDLESLESKLRGDNSERENEDGVLDDTLKIVDFVRVLRELDKKVNALCVMLDVNSDGIYFAVNLPLKEKKHLMSLENYLKSKEVRDYLYGKLSQIKANDLTHTVGKMLSKLMTNKLATSFTLLGVKTTDKAAFSDLQNINSILISAVRSNESFRDSKDADIREIIRRWLTDAPSRANYHATPHTKSRANSSKE